MEAARPPGWDGRAAERIVEVLADVPPTPAAETPFAGPRTDDALERPALAETIA
jgi:hypothetical protein